MRDFYLFTYNDDTNFKGGVKSISVLFISEAQIRKNTIIQGLEDYNQERVLSDKFVVIIPKYASEELVSFFKEGVFETFKRVVGFDKSYTEGSYSLYFFNNSGGLDREFGTLKDLKNKSLFVKELFKNGNFNIFCSRGGLIESSPDHHYVFPSGKHSEKFIRTGNVLRDSNEIFFIAIQLLKIFDSIKIVYCDTASINVLPFAVFEIQSRFKNLKQTIVKSFDSYEVFENHNQQFSPESIVLISSSTSGNIIDRLREKQITDENEILVLFFLGNDDSYIKHQKNILCNLSNSKSFKIGYEPFKTFPNSIACSLCKDHSQPVSIQTDIFLNIEPKYNIVTLLKADAPRFLSNFVESHTAQSVEENIFKVHYRDVEEEDSSYEIYLDFEKLLDNISSSSYPKYYHNKLFKKINAHIPANTKYILPLRDSGSQSLADLIIKQNSWIEEPIKIDIKNPVGIDEKIDGTLIVVGATYVTGRHYFFINRLLRRYPKLSVVYFIGIARTAEKDYSNNIKSNLGIGEYGGGTFPVIAVEEIYIPQAKENNNWTIETNFIRKALGDPEIKKELNEYFDARRKVLIDSKENKGLTNDVFLPKIDGEPLALRKGFVYWNFEVEPKIAFQSKVYFTITAVLNKLRNEPINSPRSLNQSTYVRNLISAETFNRFNDGVIQASLLRAADYKMLSYDLDEKQSFEMTVFLKSMADRFGDDHGEALPEFLLSLGLKKLKLKKYHLQEFINHSKKVTKENLLILGFIEYLEKELI